jgi:hypothetical protein
VVFFCVPFFFRMILGASTSAGTREDTQSDGGVDSCCQILYLSDICWKCICYNTEHTALLKSFLCLILKRILCTCWLECVLSVSVYLCIFRGSAGTCIQV